MENKLPEYRAVRQNPSSVLLLRDGKPVAEFFTKEAVEIVQDILKALARCAEWNLVVKTD